MFYLAQMTPGASVYSSSGNGRAFVGVRPMRGKSQTLGIPLRHAGIARRCDLNARCASKNGVSKLQVIETREVQATWTNLVDTASESHVARMADMVAKELRGPRLDVAGMQDL